MRVASSTLKSGQSQPPMTGSHCFSLKGIFWVWKAWSAMAAFLVVNGRDCFVICDDGLNDCDVKDF